jgi:phosphate-selective porin OprO/OprP
LGVAFKGEPTKGMTYAVTKYQEGFSNDDVMDENNYSGRLTYNWAEANKIKDSIFHVGIAGFTEDYSLTPKSSSNGGTTTHGTIFKFKSAGRGFSPLAKMDVEGENVTASISGKSKSNLHVENKFAALEGIFAKGPFKLQAEYGQGNFEGANEISGGGAEADVKTGYISANYILTGEHYAKSYKGGKMKGIKIKNPFDFENGTGTGAWEIGARYEYLGIDDMKTTNVAGNKENRFRGAFDCGATADTYGDEVGTSLSGCDTSINQYTIGVKWLANQNVMAKASLTYADYGEDLLPADINGNETFDSETLFQTRIQWMF